MQNLSLKELTLICRKILLRIINDNKGDKKSFLNQKKKKPKKVFISQQEIVFLN